MFELSAKKETPQTQLQSPNKQETINVDIIRFKRGKDKREYLSNTTQLACAFLASAATAPQGDPETILILTLICREKTGIRI